jgi:hypothetical protein
MGAFRLTSASLSNPSWATIPLRTWMRDLWSIPKWLYLVTPLDIMSFTTKFRKIDTRTSKGMAKGILLSIPSRGDITAIWRLESVREDWASDLDICICCSSRLRRDSRLNSFMKVREYIHCGFYERLHVELGGSKPLIWGYKWFSGTKKEILTSVFAHEAN